MSALGRNVYPHLPRPSKRCSIATPDSQGEPMSFGIYAGGFLIMIGGLVYAAHLMHVPSQWIVVGAVIMAGVGLLSAVKATRQKDPVK
jgi:hypothetical protein